MLAGLELAHMPIRSRVEEPAPCACLWKASTASVSASASICSSTSAASFSDSRRITKAFTAKRGLRSFRTRFAKEFPEAVACLERGFSDATALLAHTLDRSRIKTIAPDGDLKIGDRVVVDVPKGTTEARQIRFGARFEWAG